MGFLSSILLGILQGLTEFLPVSSSGHLVLAQNLFGIKEPELLFDTCLHGGTLLAVVIYFWSDLKAMVEESIRFCADLSKGRTVWRDLEKNPHVSLALWTVVGTVPTAIIGLLFKEPLEKLFASQTVVALMLLVTGALLFITRWVRDAPDRRRRVGFWTALAVGTAQGTAIIPGISRSGATIVCGLVCGMNRELAARYSFLLSLPAILGAVILQFRAEDVYRLGGPVLLAGFVSSALVGLLALRVLMGIVRRGRLFYFAPYCWAAGIVGLLI